MRKKRKKRNTKNMLHHNESMSKEQIIEIYEEAYYRALKRIDEENESHKITEERRKYKWYEKVLLVMNFLFWPWNIDKKYNVNSQMYDSVLVIVTSMMLLAIGGIMWIIGLGGSFWAIYKIITLKMIKEVVDTIGIIVIFLTLGSSFVLAGKSFEKEMESSKIYAYSASIFALISCAIAIVTMFIR